MKKTVFTIFLTVLCLIETAYIFSLFTQPSVNEVNSIVEFTDRLEINVDERSFISEDIPENKAEEAVLRLYLADFLNDHQLRRDSMAQNGIFDLELENERKRDLEGEKIHSYILHEMETLSADLQDAADRLDMAVIEECHLTEYEIVKLQWTEEREHPANYGNGFHIRYFVCGRTRKDTEWRIYGFGFM